MLIYGTRATNIGEFTVPQAECAHCHQRGTQRIAVFGRYAHVFWIPLFPIGKVAVSECTHCKRTLEKKEFSPELRRKYDEQSGTTSRPIWHWAGLGIIALLFSSSVIAAAFREVDPREELVEADLEALTAQPDVATDSVAYYLKDYLDRSVVEELEPQNFRYYTEETADKVLLLVQIPSLSKLDKDMRPEIVDMINELADDFPHLDGKERYIGVQGRSSLMLVSAPGVQSNSSYASESGLFGYYGPPAPAAPPE